MKLGKLEGLLEKIQIVRNEADYEAIIEDICKPEDTLVLSFINHHAFNLAHEDDQFCDALSNADCLLRDGAGLELLLKFLAVDPGLNCNGTDLIPRILKHFKGQKVALIGTQDPWLQQSCSIIQSWGVQIVLRMDGFRDEEEYLSAVLECSPQLIILGLGMPLQEKLSVKISEKYTAPCLIINGGAILDFIAKRFPRAPILVRKLRLEWLFRLLLEPRRLAKRYIYGGSLFIARTLSTAWWFRGKLHKQFSPKPEFPCGDHRPFL